MDYYWTNIFSKINYQTLDRAFSKRWRAFWKSPRCFLENSLTNSWMRLGALMNLPWRVWKFVKTCNTVTLFCHPERSEGSHGHKAMNNKVYAHEILRRKAPLDDKIENFHIESHTHLQRNSIHLKISAFLWRMCWKPSATSVTVVWQMTIARCRWFATIARWFIVWYAFVAVLQWLLQMFWSKWRNRPFHRRVNRVKCSWSMLYVYAHTRARNKINVKTYLPLKCERKPLP